MLYVQFEKKEKCNNIPKLTETPTQYHVYSTKIIVIYVEKEKRRKEKNTIE